MLIAGTTGALAQSKKPDDIVGIWESDNLKIDMFNAGPEYNARLLWGDKVVEADGKTFKLDAHNPDPSLRSRSLKGIVLIKGLTWKDGKYTGGTLYDGRSGQSYNCDAEVAEGELRLRGYVGVSLLGRTVVFRRASAASGSKS
ncbi:DUF2147 domain-containing protein [Bradyrhizobium sp. 31Argb]|uniref:DUF2147 domain-containing protein n=1 Tax=unclassified Bradyrhizobium TaxID=2631580 RepID=UPI00102ECD80|nr:DUF2147 domain-containing protein [Bradyrhizobium sp. Leo170]TAI66500.1 DUF2147 domain-containing protein [Bradyrhizobium sp. Leo170]